MTSINTNTSAMNALSTLRNVNNNLNTTQDRISSGLKVASGKDNAAYFAISETMNNDSSMNKSVSEGLTLTKNATAVGRLGAETVADTIGKMAERIAFAQDGTADVKKKVQEELDQFIVQIETAIDSSSFNGQNMLKVETSGTAETLKVVTSITRDGTTTATTTMDVDKLDSEDLLTSLKAIDVEEDGTADMAADLQTAVTAQQAYIDGATSLGIAEKAIENQQTFLTNLTDRLDSGIGGMIDANMEEEAARLQALQVQQQLSTQALSIANQGPQNILSLFR